MKPLSNYLLLLLALLLKADYARSENRIKNEVKKLPSRLPKVAKIPASRTRSSDVANSDYTTLKATSFILAEECSNDIALPNGVGVLITTPTSRQDMDCETSVTAVDERYSLELSLQNNNLKFDCSMESLTFTMDQTIVTVCSGGGSIMLRGKSLRMKYKRLLTEKFGGFLIFVISRDHSKEKIETSGDKYYDRFECGTSAYSTRSSRSAIKFPTIQTRIVGGEDAAQNQFPWMAYLKVFTRSGSFSCGGSLISDEYILTAAHCFTSDTYSVAVTLGVLNLNDPSTGITITSRVFKIHESYNDNLIEQDIALIKLPTKVTFSDAIKPVCLPTQEIGDMADEETLITGFGDLRYNGYASDILQVAEVIVWNASYCSKAWMDALYVQILPTQICALGREVQDSCLGDSGGPLISKNFDRNIILGVTSFGDRCAVPGMPGVYTRVSEFIPWIDTNMAEM